MLYAAMMEDEQKLRETLDQGAKPNNSIDMSAPQTVLQRVFSALFNPSGSCELCIVPEWIFTPALARVVRYGLSALHYAGGWGSILLTL